MTGSYDSIKLPKDSPSLIIPDEGEQLSQAAGSTGAVAQAGPTGSQGESQALKGGTGQFAEGSGQTAAAPPAGATGAAGQTIEIEGEEYLVSDIRRAILDSNNKKDWQKSNTKEAQKNADESKKLSAISKALEPTLKVLGFLDKEKDLKEDVINFILQKAEEEDKDIFKTALDVIDMQNLPDPGKPYQSEIEKRDAQIAQLTGEIELEKEKKALRKNFGLSEAEADKIEQAAIKKYSDSCRIDEKTGEKDLSSGNPNITLEGVYKEIEFDKSHNKINPIVPGVNSPRPGQGAREIESKESVSDYKDITPDFLKKKGIKLTD